MVRRRDVQRARLCLERQKRGIGQLVHARMKDQKEKSKKRKKDGFQKGVQEQRTSLPLSLSAVLISSSGEVCLGSKAAFSTAAAASSEPDFEYSFGSGLRLSLCWVSLRARVGVAWVKGREARRAGVGRAEGRVVVRMRRNMVAGV